MDLSRRSFLKNSCLSLGALCLAPLLSDPSPWLPDGITPAHLLGRVTRSTIPVYSEPTTSSQRVKRFTRDQIIEIIEETANPDDFDHNPRWYRTEQGWVHSAYIQRINNAMTNPIVESIPPSSLLGELTVPYSQSYMRNRQGFWVKLYRLYYSSVHWITGLEPGPDGQPHYRITDEWLKVHYFIPATHIKILESEDYAPFADSVYPGIKRIEVALTDQKLYAFEDDKVVYSCSIASGLKYMETPQGDFMADRKFPSKHMGNGGLTSDYRAYELVGVPWVTFFHEAGIAFHGTFWHDNFGTPMSRGCVNMTNADALWLFRWTQPNYQLSIGQPTTWFVKSEQGTQVIVY
jgi:hypothetical protein